MCYDRMRRVLRNRMCGIPRRNLYRYRVSFRRSIQIVYIDEPEPRAIGIIRKSELLCHFQVPKAARFRTEPARILEMVWENVALELFSLAISKQPIQLSWRIDGWGRAFLQRTARVDRCMQREPVIGVRAECDDVARF